MKKLIRFILPLAAAVLLLLCGTALADDDPFTMTVSGNQYTITRPEELAEMPQTVTLQTFSASALEGVNFLAASTDVSFGAGERTQTATLNVTVIPIISPSSVFRFQCGTNREYGVEVLDEDGVRMCSLIRTIDMGEGTQVSGQLISQNVTNLLYQKGNPFYSDMNGKFVDTQMTAYGYSTTGDYNRVKDSGYKQGKCTKDFGALYSSAPKEYLQAIGAKIYATVHFTMKEEYDGYQYIQILADNGVSYDGNDPKGDVDAPDKSLYKACFELSSTSSPKVNKNDTQQFFPHKLDAQVRYGQEYSTWSEFPDDETKLYKQKFKNTDYRATGTGALVLPPTTNSLTVRFDAAGEDSDTWDFKNLYLRLAACDEKGPELVGVHVKAGEYQPGSELTITLEFDEVVNSQGTYLWTNWGTIRGVRNLTYSNVVTYKGTVLNGYVGKTLQINGIGDVEDLAGHKYPYEIEPITLNQVVACKTRTFNITYDTDGGVAEDNPETYTRKTESFTLNNPARADYVFAGWTGTDLDEPTLTVTIPKGSRGDRFYTAHWVPIEDTLDYDHPLQPQSWAELQAACSNDVFIRLVKDLVAEDADEAITVPAGHCIVIDLAGHRIDRGLYSPRSKNGGNVITVRGKLIIQDSSAGGTGEITGGRNDCLNTGAPLTRGGGVYVAGGARFTMTGGTIHSCRVLHDSGVIAQGGGVYVSGGSFFTMTGGAIRNCSAEAEEASAEGGGVYVADGANFTMTGGTIKDCGALIYRAANWVRGGGVFISQNADFIMTGGRISGCSVSFFANSCRACEGAGLYVSEGSTFRVSGSPVITGNYSYGNVYLPGNQKIHVTGALHEAAYIGVTTATLPTENVHVVFTDGLGGKGTVQNFDNDNIHLVLRESVTGEAQFQLPPPITSWTELQEALNEGGKVILTQWLTAGANDSALVIPEDVTVLLDLNGNALDRGLTEKAAVPGGNVITVRGTLILTDRYISWAGKVRGGNNTGAGGGIILAAGGHLTLDGDACVTGNRAATGGGVYVTAGSTFSISDNGCVEKNTAVDGSDSNIFLETGTVINISSRLAGYRKSGVTTEVRPAKTAVFTSGLSGRGGAKDFTSDRSDFDVATDENGEGILVVAFGTPDFTLPAFMTTIEEEAFEGIAATAVWLDDKCESIGDYAFRDCPNLQRIRIPEDCAIGTGAFDGCAHVYLYGKTGGTAEAYCSDPAHANCEFVEE